LEKYARHEARIAYCMLHCAGLVLLCSSPGRLDVDQGHDGQLLARDVELTVSHKRVGLGIWDLGQGPLCCTAAYRVHCAQQCKGKVRWAC